MPYRQLFLFVEGDDDERFFRLVLEPLLRARWDQIHYVQFSQKRAKKVRAYLQSIERIEGASYLYVRDQDRLPCVTAAKEEVLWAYAHIDPQRIQIVQSEIESWYCAGIREDHPELGTRTVATCADTREVTKEQFEQEILGKRGPRAAEMMAVLESFDLDRAARRNGSLRYFLEKACRPIV